MRVVDASALLAFVQDEEGADVVAGALEDALACGAATWSEVAQTVLAAERDWALVAALLDSYDIVVEPVTRTDADRAARRWQRGAGLSLADRLCLALAERLDAEVITADSGWGDVPRVTQIR